MRVAFNDREAGKKSSAEEGGAHLAYAAPNTFNRAPVINNKVFFVTVIKSNIAHSGSHRKGCPRRNEQAVKFAGSLFNVLNARLP